MKIKDTGSVKVENIPVGTKYRITESKVEGFTITTDGADGTKGNREEGGKILGYYQEGTIVAKTSETLPGYTFTNTHEPEKVTVSGTVTGSVYGGGMGSTGKTNSVGTGQVGQVDHVTILKDAAAPEDGNHLLLAEYAEDGWTLIDYPGIRNFTVTAWCYQPEPIREVDE